MPRYDPFAPASDDPAAKALVSNTLTHVRRPHILTVPLTPLEWKPNLDQNRKRSRPPSDFAPSKKTIVKEVIKYIEQDKPSTIMGGPPLVDDRIRYVVNFILGHVNSSNVEIEAKLGLLLEKEKGVRAIELVPVLCETPIRQDSNQDTRFASDVGGEMFRLLNTRLNARIEKTLESGGKSIAYLRTHEEDVYWPGRVRETKQKRKAPDGTEYLETIRVQKKERLGDLNVLCPGRFADVRYSASLEQDCQIPNSGTPQYCRVKDRISYKYEYLSVDITCVEAQSAHGTGTDTSFEVEVEIDPSANLYGEVVKYRKRDETSKLFDIATSLVNTVRILLEIDQCF